MIQMNLFRRRPWHPTPVLLPGKSHGRGSLVGCSPWGREESDTTERLHFHFSLSCIGEGNGNPLQCSCLENPRDGGTPGGLPSMGSHRVGHDWRLKRLSSSSSSRNNSSSSRTYLQNRSRLTDIENRLVRSPKGQGGKGGINEELGVSRGKGLCIK